MRARHLLAAAAVIVTGLSPSEPSEATERPPCPEYTRGRVLFGELQTIRCDVSPPQHLDLQMWPRRLDGLTPRERCDHMGGHFQLRRVRCMDVDY